MVERRAKDADDPTPEKAEERRTSEPAVRNGARTNGKDDDADKEGAGAAPAGPWRSYKEVVARLAERIVDAQRPIRVLQALRWDASFEEKFLKNRQRELPKIGAAYYERVDLGFDPLERAELFEQIARDVDREVGERDAIGQIMIATALEYRDVVRMLAGRGTPAFYEWSRKLYGSPKDKFPDGRASVRDLGHLLYGVLTSVDEPGVYRAAAAAAAAAAVAAAAPAAGVGTRAGAGAAPVVASVFDRTIDASEAARMLGERLAAFFGDTHVSVEADDGILADAAAGSDYVKVRSLAKFSARDIDILEVHEGWVHVATSLNGQAQPVAKWLAKGPPRTSAVQEGLAALLEMLTFRTYPRRARRLNDRVLAVDKAEDGASFVDLFEWFRTEGYEEDECFHNARRVCRGGVLEGGAPFTKDACYCKGIVLNYAFIRSAIQHGRADLLPYLFVGKVAHEDIPVLARRVADGVVKPPVYLPPMFRDPSGLSIWMAYSTFFSQLGSEAIAEHYARLFARAG